MELSVSLYYELYQRLGEELRRAQDHFNNLPEDPELELEYQRVCQIFSKCHNELFEKLKDNAEWQTLNLAFYGETNAGKSTLIETLRILLDEPTKVTKRKKFKEKLEIIEREQKKRAKIEKLEQQLQADRAALSELDGNWKTQLLLKRFWLWLFQAQSKQEYVRNRQNLNKSITKISQEELPNCRNALVAPPSWDELAKFEDGKIISRQGDFTCKVQRYEFKTRAGSFILLDLPGIEGAETSVIAKIERAVQTATSSSTLRANRARPRKAIRKRVHSKKSVSTLGIRPASGPFIIKGSIIPLSWRDSRMKKGEVCRHWTKSCAGSWAIIIRVPLHFLPGQRSGQMGIAS